MWGLAADVRRDVSVQSASREDPFDFPSLDGFPEDAREDEVSIDEALDAPPSIHSDEFVDAETFMADHKPGEDSFLREVTGNGDGTAAWSDEDDTFDASDRRASAIFVPKSRSMEKVEFSSPKETIRKSFSVNHEEPIKMKVRSSVYNSTHPPAFSASNTAISSEYDIHVDNRLILTPNSFKYLQQRERLPTEDFSLSNGSAEGVAHSSQAKQVVDASAASVSKLPDIPPSPARPTSTEKAMHAGPGVIKKALHEIESMLRPLDLSGGESDPEYDPSLVKLTSRSRENPDPVDLNDPVDKPAPVVEPNTTQREYGTQARMPEMNNEGIQVDPGRVSDPDIQATTYLSPPRIATRTFAPPLDKSMDGDGKMRISSLNHHVGKSQKVEEDMRTHLVIKSSMVRQDVDDIDQTHPRTVAASAPLPQRVPRVEDRTELQLEGEVSTPKQVDTFSDRRPARPMENRPVQTSFRRSSLRQSADPPFRAKDTEDHDNQDLDPSRMPSRSVNARLKSTKTTVSATTKAKVSTLPLAVSVPSQMARRCRRFLCTVGERMSEQVVFSNGSSKVGRICVSLLPMSKGCQQFSVTPAVLELEPRSRSAFTVTFSAFEPGVVAGIFQFRAVGVDNLYEPYEVLIEASVRGDLQLAPGIPRPKPSKRAPPSITSSSHEPRVTELPPQALAGVQISPTFLRFTTPTDANAQDVMASSSIRITNTTVESVDFQVKCSHEHLQISQPRGTLMAGSDVKIKVRPLCRPFGIGSDASRDWCGSMTVVVGDVLSREVSIVIDRERLSLLPSFDKAARVRQAISTQTDSFYYTKKVNRRGLYFHARAVECGSCMVGESHQVPVYICNGSDAPMTVFLQELQAPFSCAYQPTTLQARKFIEVPVAFTPKATGKVATCLVAYTVSGKAAVTLIARGIDNSATTVHTES